MLGAEYKAALSDFEVKSTVYKEPQSRSIQKGLQPLPPPSPHTYHLHHSLCFHLFFFLFYF